MRSLLMGLHARLELAILSGHKEPSWLRRIRRIRKARESLLSGNEAFMVYSLARSQSRLPGGGDMAEVGVYQGCSARIMSEASGGSTLHLFDTFSGLPCPTRREQKRLREGQYTAPLASVRSFLADCPNVHFHVGRFPASADALAETRFSFVHLDVDLRSSTLASLEFFYPRMNKGGVILTHDFSYLEGVREAFAEFFRDRDERPVELPTSQAMITKL